jgi:hydroxymethylglutaryl-CoA lyase
VARQLSDLGCYEISLGETLGKGNPDQVEKMLINVLDEIPVNKIAAHFHDTNGQALKNIGVALDLGVRVFDSAVAGLGGCPFAPGSPGNVATESLLKYVEGKGYEPGLDIEQVIKAANLARGICNI